ncbi:MAG: CvpA family protein [Patescibacteria group bacterium]
MNIINGNWIDLIIILVFIYFASEAWRHGLWVILAEFASFLGSLLIALRGYKFMSMILVANFNLPNSIANALGFLLTAVVSEVVLGYVFAYLVGKLPQKIRKAKYNKALAVLPAVGQGIILVAFVLTILIGMPIKGEIKENIAQSKIGGYLVKKTSIADSSINDVFGGVINDSLTYLTVKPDSGETLKLNVPKRTLTIDATSERQMFILVNKERKDKDVSELVWSDAASLVARDHAKDMWERQYFSHYSPEGGDVGDRLQKQKAKYYVAGENLALAPTLAMAHTGLMNSEGHRANILEPRFKRMGIGVIDNGYYGKIFVQVFTD